MIGMLTIQLRLPGCRSLKEKRSQIKPLLAQIHRKFNVSVAEVGLQDKWSASEIACCMLGNDNAHLQRSLMTVRKWIEANWRDGQVIDDGIEVIM
jgi:uncharacterized protein YlxP (DUF503 family)